MIIFLFIFIFNVFYRNVSSMPKFSWFLEVLDDKVRPDVVEVLGENLLAEEASEHCLGVLNGMPPNKHIEPVSKLLVLHH